MAADGMDAPTLIKPKLSIEGAGGGRPDTPRAPVEAPNNLKSRALGKIVEVLSEGEIVGLIDGDKSVFLNRVPLQNADGTYNFEGVSYETRNGTPDQTYLEGYPRVGGEVAVATEVTFGTPVVRRIIAAATNRTVVTLNFPALVSQDEDTGDTNGASVDMTIEVKSDADNPGSVYVLKVRDYIQGKTVSNYERSYDIPLEGVGPWDIRVTRNTADSASASLQNSSFWSRYTEVQDYKLAYADTAVVGATVNSELFGSAFPARAYEIDGMLVQYPSNYNPTTRAYTGIWDGTFSTGWTDNPVWVFYDVLVNKRYGAGIDPQYVDKWGLYTIAQYCDELVDDGKGGTEPRFTFNGVIQNREDAYKVLQSIASNFRAMIYMATGGIYLSQDRPKTRTRLYNTSNVKGYFNYSGSAREARHTVAQVQWINPDQAYEPDIEVVENRAQIVKYGYRLLDVAAFGCTSRGQARRQGKWVLLTELYEKDIVQFVVGSADADVLPGEIVEIQDPLQNDALDGGRCTALSTTGATLDREFTFDPARTYTLSVHLKDLSVYSTELVNPGTTTDTVTFVTAIGDSNLIPDSDVLSIWVLSDDQQENRQFRVTKITDEADATYKITATEYNEDKFALVDTTDPIPNDLDDFVADFEYSQIAAPSNFEVKFESGFKSRQRFMQARLDWEPVQHQFLRSYTVSYQREDDNWITLPETDQTHLIIENLQPGRYRFVLRAVTSFGAASAPSVMESDFTGTNVATGQDIITNLRSEVGGSSFEGPDCRALWDAAALSQLTTNTVAGKVDPILRQFRVRVLDPSDDSELRVEYVTEQEYTYTQEKNITDFGGQGSRSVKLAIAAEDLGGAYSNEVSQTFANPAPALPGVTPDVSFKQAILRHGVPSDPDYVGLKVWASTTSPVVMDAGNLIHDGPGEPVIAGDADTTVYYRYQPFDQFGTTGASISVEASVDLGLIENGDIGAGAIGEVEIADGSIGEGKFASSLTPTRRVSSLPNPSGYSGPDLVFNTTDGKLYRYTSGAWTAAVPTTDLNGQIITTQIEDDAITTAKILSGAVVTDSMQAGSVTAAILGAQAVTAESVAIGGYTNNRLLNGDATSGTEAWSVVGGSGNVLTAPSHSNSWVGSNRFNIAGSSNTAFGARAVPVEPGRKYLFRIALFAAASNSSGLYLRINYSAAYPAGGYVTSGLRDGFTNQISNGAAPTSWTLYEYEWECPAGVYWASPSVYKWTGLQGIDLIFDGVELIEKTTGSLIVDGEITAKKLSSNFGTFEDYIRVGSLGSTTDLSFIAGNNYDTTYRMWVGALSSSAAPFRVTKDGKIIARDIEIRNDADVLIFDSTNGFSDTARNNMLLNSGTLVNPATTTGNDSANDSFPFTLFSETVIDFDVELPMVYVQDQYNEGASPGVAAPGTITLNTQIRTGGAGSFVTVDTQVLTLNTHYHAVLDSNFPPEGEFGSVGWIVYRLEGLGAYKGPAGQILVPTMSDTLTPAGSSEDYELRVFVSGNNFQVTGGHGIGGYLKQMIYLTRNISMTDTDPGQGFLVNDGGAIGGDVVNADTLGGNTPSYYLDRSNHDFSSVPEFNGGDLYDPTSSGAGSDTASNVGFALGPSARIVGHTSGYIRTLLTWAPSGDIEIGQGGTSIIGGIDLKPGNAGIAKYNGDEIATRTWVEAQGYGAGGGSGIATNDGIDFGNANPIIENATGGGYLMLRAATDLYLYADHASGDQARMRILNTGTGVNEFRMYGGTTGHDVALYFGDNADVVRAGFYFDTSTNVLQFREYNNTEVFRLTGGQIRAVNGSASAPAYSFTSGPDSGMWYASDGVYISHNNPSANHFRIDDDGVVFGEGGTGTNTGAIGMTVNDGYGNANFVVNHYRGVPDVSASSYRIECTADSGTAIMNFEMKSSVTAGAATSLTQILQLREDYIQVGTSSTDTKLRLYRADDNNSQHIQFYNGTTLVGEIGCQDTTWFRFNQHTAKNMYTPRYWRMDGGLMVGGGSATSPTIRHHTDANTGLYWPNDDTLRVTTAGVQRAYFNATALYVNDLRQISDENWKENFRPMPYGLAEIRKLKPKLYTMKDTGEDEVGFVSQDVQKVAPLFVSKGADEDGPLSLNYAKMGAMYAMGIQQLDTEQQLLKAEVIRLRAEVDQLKKAA